jgi:Meiotically up-regulated gene 113
MGWVTYFVTDENSGLVKIGTTDNPAVRLKQLQTGNGNPLKMVLTLPVGSEHLGNETTGSWNERAMQRRFSQYHIRGEWFALSDEIRLFISDMIAEGA